MRKINFGKNLRPVIFLTIGHFKMRAFSDKRQCSLNVNQVHCEITRLKSIYTSLELRARVPNTECVGWVCVGGGWDGWWGQGMVGWGCGVKRLSWTRGIAGGPQQVDHRQASPLPFRPTFQRTCMLQTLFFVNLQSKCIYTHIFMQGYKFDEFG